MNQDLGFRVHTAWAAVRPYCYIDIQGHHFLLVLHVSPHSEELIEEVIEAAVNGLRVHHENLLAPLDGKSELRDHAAAAFHG